MLDPDKPPKIPPRLKAAPKIRGLYWCNFPVDAQLPEFWKTRPVLIISYKNTLYGAVTVIPISTVPQDDNPWACKMTTSFENRDAWAICDKPTTVAVSRLAPDKNGVLRVTEAEFGAILEKLFQWLPRLEGTHLTRGS
jgi:mRNA interferase MazF